jgi:hypothetical protein
MDRIGHASWFLTSGSRGATQTKPKIAVTNSAPSYTTRWDTTPQVKPYKLSDERSLFLLIMPNGAKYLRLCYRFLDKQKVLSLAM